MNAIQTRIDTASERVRPYLSPLVKRMARTYLPPVILGIILNLFGREILAQFIPYSATALLGLVVFIAILYFGWRALDKQFGGIRLYMLWLIFSRDRRALRALLTQPDKIDSAVLSEHARQMEQSADEFIRASEAG